MVRSYIIDIICILLIVLFGYASTSKIADYETFKMQLGQSPFIEEHAGIIAWGVPAIELAAVVLLIFSKGRLLGLYLSLFLMTLFSAYIFAMLRYSYYIPCSCGGILNKLQWKDHFYFNLFFVALSITGIWLCTKPNKQPASVNDQISVA